MNVKLNCTPLCVFCLSLHAELRGTSKLPGDTFCVFYDCFYVITTNKDWLNTLIL